MTERHKNKTDITEYQTLNRRNAKFNITTIRVLEGKYFEIIIVKCSGHMLTCNSEITLGEDSLRKNKQPISYIILMRVHQCNFLMGLRVNFIASVMIKFNTEKLIIFHLINTSTFGS